MRYLIQAIVSLVLLVGMPIFAPPPTTRTEEGMAIGAAVILAALAIHGVVHYVRSRRPKVYLDSIMPEKHVEKQTLMEEKPKE